MFANKNDLAMNMSLLQTIMLSKYQYGELCKHITTLIMKANESPCPQLYMSVRQLKFSVFDGITSTCTAG